MNEKKFHFPTITLSAAALIGMLATGFVVEGWILAVISIVLCVKNKDKARTSIGLALSVITVLLGIVYLALYYHMYCKFGVTDMYWLINLIFN